MTRSGADQQTTIGAQRHVNTGVADINTGKIDVFTGSRVREAENRNISAGITGKTGGFIFA